jgi:hypothetical protein
VEKNFTPALNIVHERHSGDIQPVFMLVFMPSTSAQPDRR